MRSVWKGSVSFGLVYIPVAVYSASHRDDISFRQLRASDHSLIRYRKVADADGEEVPADQIVRGYEYEKGKFVIVSDDDLDHVKLAGNHNIEIVEFIDQTDVDPLFFYKPYFLEPQKGGEKVYALLQRALLGTNKIGIAKVVIRNNQHLAAVKPYKDALLLELMYFAEEIADVSKLTLPSKIGLSDREVQMARTLIDSMTAKWDPTKYENEQYQATMAMIQEKTRTGKTTAAPSPQPAKADIIDLLSVLQQSINQNKDIRREEPVKRETKTRSHTRSAKATTKRRSKRADISHAA